MSTTQTLPSNPADLTAMAGRYAGKSAAEVLAEQHRLIAAWSAEDTARRARNAAILAAL